MRQLYPPVPPTEDPEVDLTPADLRTSRLAAGYRWPAGDAVTVRANMVASLDGRATRDGRSGGLGNPADQRLLGLLRRMSDVVLVGAGTVLAEQYTGLGLRWAEQPPPLAVVTTRPLPPELGIFTTTRIPPILLTDAVTAPALAGLPADVVVVGKDTADPGAVIAALAGRGHRRVLCEGGPTLLGRLISAGRLDELCLTLSPAIAGAHEIPVIGATGPGAWHLQSVFIDHDHLFTRYRRTP